MLPLTCVCATRVTVAFLLPTPWFLQTTNPSQWFPLQIIFHHLIFIYFERVKETLFYYCLLWEVEGARVPGTSTVFWFVDVYFFGFQNPRRGETQRLIASFLGSYNEEWQSEPSPFTPRPKFLGRQGVSAKGICPHLTGWKNCAGYKKLAVV